MNAVFDAMNSVCSAMVAFLASVAVFLSARHPFTPTMNITLATYEHVPDAKNATMALQTEFMASKTAFMALS